MSIDELQKLLSYAIPGWNTQRIGNLDDPENLRTPATVLDSLLHSYGDPAQLNILSPNELAPLQYPFDYPRAFYTPPKKQRWTINPYDAEYKSDVWWKSTFNPIGYIAEKMKGVDGQGTIHASTLHGVIEELAHDIQFKDPQYKASKTGHADYVDAGDPLYSSAPYETEGALEHEAHSVISPKLWDLLIKMKTLNRDSTIGSIFDLGTNKYPYHALYEYEDGTYGLPIEQYKRNPLHHHFAKLRTKDGQNQSQTIQPTSSVHDVGKVH